MKSIFEKETREQLVNRINSLSQDSVAQWGKMNVSQMIRHCAKWDEMALGKKKYTQSFAGRLFGRMALKNMMNDKPMKRNLPTVPSFKMTGDTDVAEEKRKWIELLAEYDHFPGDGFIHPFFGVMTKEQTGYFVYKHIDHHLIQFNT